MIKLVMCLGIFPIESVAMNFTDINECADGTSKCSADAMCNNTDQDLLEMDGLAKVKQSLVSESNVN